jgi:hypothetical protein
MVFHKLQPMAFAGTKYFRDDLNVVLLLVKSHCFLPPKDLQLLKQLNVCCSRLAVTSKLVKKEK